MNRLQTWIRWLNEHPEAGLDLLRAYLGVGLLVRGVLMIGAPEAAAEQLAGDPAPFVSAAIMHYVALAHLVGGALMALGLITRIAAIVQIPVLVGAVFFVHVEEGLLASGQSLEFSAFVLFALVVFALFGAGRWSVDYYIFEREAPEQSVEAAAARSGRAPIYRWEQEEAEAEPEPVSEGGTATAVAAETTVKRTAAKQTSKTKTCDCGNDLTHRRVTAEPRYSLWATLYFVMGISAPVKEVVFWCEKCGTIMKRTRDPEVLRKYRYRSG
jgi:uncharacterized membrane protein YphA (DoxX/SURF4 family)